MFILQQCPILTSKSHLKKKSTSKMLFNINQAHNLRWVNIHPSNFCHCFCGSGQASNSLQGPQKSTPGVESVTALTDHYVFKNTLAGIFSANPGMTVNKITDPEIKGHCCSLKSTVREIIIWWSDFRIQHSFAHSLTASLKLGGELQ